MSTQNKQHETPSVTAEDRARLEAALLDLGSQDYERVRQELIAKLGYDMFRNIQNQIFKKIARIN